MRLWTSPLLSAHRNVWKESSEFLATPFELYPPNVQAKYQISKQVFNQTVIPLRYTPRKMQISVNKFIVITETSHKSYCWEETQRLKQLYYKDSPETLDLSDSQIGPLRAPSGCWAACIRIFSPLQNSTIELYELQDNETIVSQYICQLPQFENQEFLFIGSYILSFL